MKKIILTTIIACSFCAFIRAQHAPQFSNFMFNKLAYNPAYAGSSEVLSMSAIYRNQWVGIEGAPTTINFNAHTPFFNGKCGGGISIISDKAGLLNMTYVNLSYAYRMPVGETSTLSMGVMGRLEHGRIDWQNVAAIDEVDQMMGMDDRGNTKPNFGVGLYLSNEKYYVGVSAPQLLLNSLYSEQNYQQDMRTYYVMGGFITKVSDNIKFKPGVLLSINSSAPFEMDINASLVFMDAFWLGASYRLGDSFDAILAYQFNPQLRVGLGLDFTTSKLRDYTSGGFEVIAQYSFNYNEKSINNLRYF